MRTGERDPNFRHNAVTAVLDSVFFRVALTFISISSVLPAFVSRFTDSSLVVGMTSAVYYGGSLLPQAFVARRISGWPRKKPLASALLAGRAAFFVVGIALLGGMASQPGRMLALFFVCLTLFVLSDGAAMVPWWDIIGRALPAAARSRVYGLAQALGAMLGVGAGLLIAWLLSDRGPAFPTDYGILFILAGLFLIPSTIALLAFREPQPAGNRQEAHTAAVAEPLRAVFSDRQFRKVIGCRLLLGSMGLATPFYAIHATQVLGMPESTIGVFTVAQTAAVVVAGLGLGALGARRGSRTAIWIASSAALVSPLFALLAHRTATPTAVALYPIVFVGLGIAMSAEIVGFGNYVLELAPEGLHGAYIGLGNTILGVQALAPVLGGWVLRTASYPLLFGLSALGIAAAIAVGTRLKPPRARELR